MEDNKARLLKYNNDLELKTKDRVYDLNKQIFRLKNEFAEKKKQIEAWRPQVDPAINKLSHLHLLGEIHNKVCPSFSP